MPDAAVYRSTFLLCLAEILALAAIAAFPALLPRFQALWGLSNTEAGWINAAYFAGYVIFVPLLAGVTDRIDARKVMAAGAAWGAVAAFCFALLADGFWTALLLRFAAGISLAGVYMPGLKVVSDNTEGRLQSRFVSFYTASFAIGTSLSYLVAGEIQAAAGWRWAFAACGAAALTSFALILFLAPAAQTRSSLQRTSMVSDFSTALENREARAYILGYTAHMWELFCMRSWIVALLTFNLALREADPAAWTPTRLAFFINLIGLPASIAGNELARLWNRRRLVAAVMVASAGVGCLLGISTALPYALVAGLALIYGVTVVGDSAALTAGAVGAAAPGYRGATLAVHSTLGFAAAFLGPLAVGIVLDLFGGRRFAWAMGCFVMVMGGLAGLAPIVRARPRKPAAPQPPRT